MPSQMRASLRWLIVLLAVFTSAAMLAPQSAVAQRPPNVVLIFADDLGWGDVGFNGRKEWSTPNLDRLARQGVRFERWYTGAVTCAPSRAVLMTGKYGIHNGVTANNDDLPAEEVTIAEALKPLGYRTALFGKWHHGRPRPGRDSYVHPMDQGFDEFFGFTNATHAWEHFPKELWFGREKKPVQGYTATLFTDRAVRFLNENRNQPFFLYLPYTESHFHIEAPEEDVAKFRGKFEEKDPSQPYNAIYAAMITRLDLEIGRVLKTLDDLQLSDNTLVIFTSDHGATFEGGNKGASAYHDSNHPFRGQKRLLWEGGIRVPGVVRWPGKVPAGQVSRELVHAIDVLPTVVSAAGGTVDSAWKVDGQNLLPVWMGKEKGPERTLFWEWRVEGYHQLAAMRGKHKLIITGNTAPELYDLDADPTERINRFPELAPLGRGLRRELNEWLATETEAAKWGKKPPGN